MRERKFVYNVHNARIIYSAIKSAGIDFVIYVPETWTREILKLILQDTEIESVNATGEAEAMAIAAGASLGGKKPMVLMEGSGYGTSIYVLSRLGLMHHMSWLIMSSHAGGLGELGFYHWDIRITAEPLLSTLLIPHCAIQRIEDADTLVTEAQLTVEGQKVPFAILLPHHILWQEAK